MEFSLDGMLSRAKPAACAASPVDFVAREITRRHYSSDVCIPTPCFDSSPGVTAPLSFCDRYSAPAGESPLTLSLTMITCQDNTQAHYGTSPFWYQPQHAHIHAR